MKKMLLVEVIEFNGGEGEGGGGVHAFGTINCFVSFATVSKL